MNIQLFLMVVSLGIAIPCTIMVLFNITLSLVKEGYNLSLHKLSKMYIVALVAWSLLFSLR